jgi:ribosomal protein L11 methyltransferase
MPKYAEYLKVNGELWVSGFYQEDIPHLTLAAEAVGLTHMETRHKNEWQWMRFRAIQ